jgi:uncharacterized membrane protein
MNEPDFYAPLSVILSALGLLGFLALLWLAVHDYRRYHDDRAATHLMSTLTIVVVSVGMLISAGGFYAGDTNWALAGLTVVRAAILVGSLTVLATLVSTGLSKDPHYEQAREQDK